MLPAALFFALSYIVPAASSDGLEPPIPSDAVALGEPGRFESKRTWEDTMEWYEYHFRTKGGGKWRNVVNLPAIKAKHIQSTRPKTAWQGLNIYELKGHVRIFIVPRDPPPAKPAAAGPPAKSPAKK